MTPTIPARINQLAQSGMGLSPQDIASIIGVDAVEVLTYMRDNSHVITPPGGGGAAIKSLLLSGTETVTAGQIIPLAALTKVDTIGATIAAEAPYLVLPKGYYAGLLTATATGITTISPTDVWRVQIFIQCGGFHAGAWAPPSNGFTFYGHVVGIEDAVSRTGIAVPFAFESADQDATVLGLAEHGYALLAAQAQLRNETAGLDDTSTVLSMDNLQLYIQKLGDKA